ncbi:GmrSD restriction endonuclease domain-containing protein [Olsenella uli]|uniref:GmrSD restriction endonuclease domain-containing protein n=1 Tax=Olsenella uli TaxID=133926 RepID=UPI000450DBBE|nr:DUF262 domain-containing protein [Olsenella uli]EUB31583.1 PF03235 family protein [Olsenella uli MSTE5]
MPGSIYSPITPEIGTVLNDVLLGRIGLPDLQRPFVWKNDKVRDLLDSMLRGYPIGYIMLWESPGEMDDKKTVIGFNSKTYTAPKELVIDGQQRLTALLSAFYGVSVRDKSYKERVIRIAYDPLNRTFKVADAATDRDPRYVSAVSEVFKAYKDNTFYEYCDAFFDSLNESNEKKGEPAITNEGRNKIRRGFDDLIALEHYLVPTLNISYQADEEMVAEIFVRVNSKGQALGQDDFIMTLLSVYEPEMRERIEEFCAKSHVPAQGTSYNPLIVVSPTHVIRATVGVGFKRGRLRYAYQILRGRNLQTKETSAETRIENFEKFGKALDKVLDLNNWHAYINILAQAGYISSSQVTSANALFFCYAFYLIGKYEFGMDTIPLQKLTRRWFYASALTAFYVGSFESAFERQLNDVAALGSADEFVAYFEREIAALLTDDYFRVTLPQNYDANEATGPSWQGFVAAQVVLGVKVLFSTAPLAQLLTMGSSGKKNALDKHHLFPDHYLKERGYFSNRSNRANFTYLDYQNNIYIQDDAPQDYVPRYRDALGEDKFKRCCREHALPEGFESMDYEEFLAQRRVLMAQLVKDGFERL